MVLNLKAVAHFETTEIEKILFLQLATVTEDEIYSVYRLMCLKTLKGVSLELLQNSYAVEKTDVTSSNYQLESSAENPRVHGHSVPADGEPEPSESDICAGCVGAGVSLT